MPKPKIKLLRTAQLTITLFVDIKPVILHDEAREEMLGTINEACSSLERSTIRDSKGNVSYSVGKFEIYE